MAAGVYNFTIEQGTTFVEVFTWQNADSSARNLTGYTGKMQIRDAPGGSSLIAEANTTDGSMVLGGSQGTITITFSATVTSSWSFKAAAYDIELTSGTGVVVRLLKGAIRLDLEVTK